MKTKPVDKQFLFSVILLMLAGMIIFFSASLGLLTREGASFGEVTVKQLFIGFFLGFVLMFLASRFNYHHYRKYSFYIFIISAILTLLVFVPKIGMSHGGARRWIIIAGQSFQPSELLKIGVVVYFAAWLSGMKDKISQFKYGLLPLIIILAVSGAILLKQPDTDTFLVIFFSLITMFIAGGGKLKHILLLFLISAIGLFAVAEIRPYVMQRFVTFANPARDPTGAGYQIQQSLIALGSGGVFGRGFGKSLQKFSYLPEPIGDSIFAVAGEEFGFIGGVVLISLFLFFALKGFRIAIKSPDLFGGLLALGIVILIVSSSFINMASMLGVIPISGLPLLFVSQGGTALLFALAEVGIVLNISRARKV